MKYSLPIALPLILLLASQPAFAALKEGDPCPGQHGVTTMSADGTTILACLKVTTGKNAALVWKSQSGESTGNHCGYLECTLSDGTLPVPQIPGIQQQNTANIPCNNVNLNSKNICGTKKNNRYYNLI